MSLTDSIPDPERTAIAARMRRLYSLAFHVCGGSHRAVQRLIGRDVRSMMAANDIPTLASVVDLARALDMRPSVAVELLVASGLDPDAARSAECVVPWTRPADESFDEPLLHAADLADDGAVLERMLGCLPPERTTLQAALLARILTIQGSTTRALTLLQSVDTKRTDPGAMQLLRAAIGEIAILRPEAIEAIRALPPSLARTSRDGPGFPSNPIRHGIEVRDHFHGLATGALLANESSEGGERLDRMASELDRFRRSEHHQVIAWTASITVLTALALLARKPRDRAAADRIRRISVLAGFVLDDVVRCGEPVAERLACARRARVVLAERATRARCGEDPFGLLDPTDLAELRAATLRFPEADLCIYPFRHFGSFSQHRDSALDEPAFPFHMPRSTRCARGGAHSLKDRRQNAGR